MLSAIFTPQSMCNVWFIDLLVYEPETPLSGPLSAETAETQPVGPVPPRNGPAVLFLERDIG